MTGKMPIPRFVFHTFSKFPICPKESSDHGIALISVTRKHISVRMLHRCFGSHDHDNIKSPVRATVHLRTSVSADVSAFLNLRDPSMCVPTLRPAWTCPIGIVALLSLASMNGNAADPPQREPAPPTLKDVRYGPYERNVLDVYKAKRKNATPVLIRIHGGGWMGGDKFPYDATPFLEMGISVVSINYRLINKKRDKDAAHYPAPMQDCARAVQFVRSQAKEWNIDPKRVALTGGSAGAVNCMWIAYHDDMAHPDSEDPVLRLSTRVTCLVPEAGPTTFDPDLVLSRVGRGPRKYTPVTP